MNKIILSFSVLATIAGGHLSAQNNDQNNVHQEQHLAPGASDYYAPMTEQDKRDISYIIMTLANKSQISLLFEKGSLDQAGNRVGHVHPLIFLAYVFSDDQLRHAVTKIRGTPWNRFAGEMGQSLADEARLDNIKKEYLADYAKKTGVPESKILPAAENGQWVEFINITRQNIR